MTTRTILASILLVACNAGTRDHAERAPGKVDASAPAAAKEPEPDPHAGHDPHAAHREQAAKGDAYDLVLATEPSPPKPKADARLVFDPRASDGSRVERLAIVHEKPLHLLLVSRDLSFFAHEHPERQDAGTYALDFAFPEPGEYVLFGDFTPEGARGQVVRMPLTVAGEPRPARPLTVDDRGSAKRFGELSIALGPPEIRAGAETMLAFTIGDDPDVRLRPYLGAMGHCVVIDETATTFLHSHPMQGEGAAGNVVQFHTVFPEPGKYKVWGQFDVDGQMAIADFVVDVAAAGDATPSDGHGDHVH